VTVYISIHKMTTQEIKRTKKMSVLKDSMIQEENKAKNPSKSIEL